MPPLIFRVWCFVWALQVIRGSCILLCCAILVPSASGPWRVGWQWPTHVSSVLGRGYSIECVSGVLQLEPHPVLGLPQHPSLIIHPESGFRKPASGGYDLGKLRLEGVQVCGERSWGCLQTRPSAQSVGRMWNARDTSVPRGQTSSFLSGRWTH